MRAVLSSVILVAAGSATAQEGHLRVVGGAPAPDGVWEDAVGVVFDDAYVGCTGTLVAPDVVVTAAHCIDWTVTHVVVGANDYYRDDTSERIEVVDRARHPVADMGILVLAEESRFTPRPLALGCVIEDYLEDGAPVAIVGFGMIDRDAVRPSGGQLYEGFTRVTDHDCTSLNRGCDPSLSPGGEILAGNYEGDGVDSCNGDSGGPLYLRTEVGDYLVGITSRAANGGTSWCGDGGIYVRPDAVVDFIEEAGGREIPVPTCNFPPEVADDTLRVPQGRSRTSTLRAVDPERSALRWRVVVEPEHGVVELDEDGTYEFFADEDYLGEDRFVVEVADTEGFPLQTAQATVTVRVVERGLLGCGCASGGGPVGGMGALGLLGLAALRRRTVSGRT